MSTILNALQKQTAEQTYKMPYTQSNRHWKVALFISLLVIVALLSTLIFILLNPLVDSASKNTQAEMVLQAKPAKQPLPAINSALQNETAEKLISKVSFPTKRLPIPVNKTISEEVETALVEASEKAVVLSDETEQPEALPEIDYSNVSDELQLRFERALLMDEKKDKEFIESENSDGADLHQMASDFQDRVPAISYDFHVYSSVVQERWIRINGEDLIEGQFDSSDKLQVVEIQPNRTIFRLGSQSFSLQSLTDWQGF